jgi:hypothetical protein
MKTEPTTRSDRTEEHDGGLGDVSCCGMSFAAMAQECPCGSLLRRHRVAAFTWLAACLLIFLMLSAGWVLGVIAFFQTL